MNAARAPIASVVFDVDSTLTGIEGVDWLADRRDAATAEFVHRLTDAVMAGELPIERAYAARLDRIAPTRDEMHALAAAYGAHTAAGAVETIAALRRVGVRVVAISGGLLEAVGPFCASLGIGARDVHAVAAQWSARGVYAGFDRASPLVTQTGKAVLLDRLALPRSIIAVGDGSTDVEMKRTGAADLFAAYVGFARRERVVAAADFVLETCADLLTHVPRNP